jgi:hypothetical protein
LSGKIAIPVIFDGFEHSNNMLARPIILIKGRTITIIAFYFIMGIKLYRNIIYFPTSDLSYKQVFLRKKFNIFYIACLIIITTLFIRRAHSCLPFYDIFRQHAAYASQNPDNTADFSLNHFLLYHRQCINTTNRPTPR